MQRIHVTIRLLKREDSVLYFPPEAFGPFRVLHQIGAGTLGPVFRGHEPARDRLVAIKVLRLGFTLEQAAALVGHLEALIAIDLRHPTIAAPVAAGVDADAIYLVQEHAVGESLDSLLRERGPLPTEEVVRIVESAASAIDYAASRGVTHGALHPRDILVSTDGVRVTGFGMAGALAAMFAKPPVRPPYASPAGPSDVYALGAIAFEALTGKGVSAEHLEAVEATHGGKLQAVMGAALFGEPHQRFERAGDLARALSASAPIAPIAPIAPVAPAAPLAPVAPTTPVARRWPIVAMFLAFAVVVSIAVGLILDSPTPTALPELQPALEEPTVDVPRISPPASERPTEPEAAPPSSVPAPARPAASADERVSGSLLVRSTPADADVLVNGRVRGRTPLTLRELAPGSYTIRVARDGYAVEERTIQVTAQQPAVSTTFDLEPVTAPGTDERSVGSVSVRSRPAGARVFVNDRLMGLTPLAVPGLAAGPAAVRIEMDGYRAWATTVHVSVGAQTAVSASLETQ